MATAKPGDYTGRERARLAKDNEAALQERAQEIGMLQQAEIESVNNDILDVTEKPAQPTVVDEVQLVESDETDSEVIRVAEDCEEVSINKVVYNFKAGRRYRVPKNVAFVLREKGALYERSA